MTRFDPKAHPSAEALLKALFPRKGRRSIPIDPMPSELAVPAQTPSKPFFARGYGYGREDEVQPGLWKKV